MVTKVRFQFLASIVFIAAAVAPQALAQTQYFIGNPSPEQQYMLELINRAREWRRGSDAAPGLDQ
jgi:hypothetical protein